MAKIEYALAATGAQRCCGRLSWSALARLCRFRSTNRKHQPNGPRRLVLPKYAAPICWNEYAQRTGAEMEKPTQEQLDLLKKLSREARVPDESEIVTSRQEAEIRIRDLKE